MMRRTRIVPDTAYTIVPHEVIYKRYKEHRERDAILKNARYSEDEKRERIKERDKLLLDLKNAKAECARIVAALAKYKYG